MRPGGLAGDRGQREPGLRRLGRGPGRPLRRRPRHGARHRRQGLANPTAIFLALSMLLYQLGEISVGQAVKNATLDLLREGVRTADLGGKENTESFTAAVAAEVKRRLGSRRRLTSPIVTRGDGISIDPKRGEVAHRFASTSPRRAAGQ
ncbi:MAG: isocitrate/isopropylmalate family dehydrogenase [Isosphaeraceae bacterium]